MGLETGTLMAIGAITSAVTGVASGAMQVMGGIQQANTQEAMAKAQMEASQNQAKYQSDMANYNAQIAEQNATTAEQEAHEAERRKRAENARLLSSQRALYGKSGVALTEGSPLAVLGDTAANQEMDALDIRRSGVIRANNLRQDANMYRHQGDLALSQAITSTPSYKGSLLSSVGQGVGTMIGSAGQFASNWAKVPSKQQIPGTAEIDAFSKKTKADPYSQMAGSDYWKG